MEAVNYGGKRYGYGRRALSFLMALAMVFSMVSSLTITASAKSESERVLNNERDWVGPRAEFWIKGNLLSHKKVTLSDVYLACGQGLTFPKSEKWYQDNTRYNVWVLKKDNSHIYKYSYLKRGQTFKLPIGKRDWKVIIQPERITNEGFSGYTKTLWSFARYKISY